ncbi:recombinase family protein [Paenibacillus agilis]|uniref:Recombinase family protein n=1 Tax=Paenibacillus agilis TaxID=3020863 RepID=A0A559IZL4_9BACL|nr:recombinase family protein [Paenibacillus agilis]TVX93062.1 recombinase family protein [Paenibacillus agilis]
MKAVIYARARDLISVQKQIELCNNFAKVTEYEVIEIFQDVNVNVSDKHSSFNKMKTLIDQHKELVVICASLDRLYRDSLKVAEFIHFLEKNNSVIKSASYPLGHDHLKKMFSLANFVREATEEAVVRHGFEFPEQGTEVGSKVLVSFNGKPQIEYHGTIVRSDDVEPFNTIIKLDDGRYILDTECAFELI